jgi:hypothetical protein
MGSEKNIRKGIPALYKCQAEDLLLFGWVTAQQRVVPSITVTQSVEMFMRYFDISEEDWAVSSALMTISRMREKYFKKSHI